MGGSDEHVFRQDGVTRDIVPVDQSTSGDIGNDLAYGAHISANGRYVVFASLADNLVPKDKNDTLDVFRRDVQTGTTALVSASTEGVPGDNTSTRPVISANGRFVAFTSRASDLVADPPQTGIHNVYIRDMTTGMTSWVARGLDHDGLDGITYVTDISADGRFLALSSSATNLTPREKDDVSDIFWYDRTSDTAVEVTRALDGSRTRTPSIVGNLSDDGSLLIFDSKSGKLVADDTNKKSDAFLYHADTGAVTLLSHKPGGKISQGRSFAGDLSPDGSHAVYYAQYPDQQLAGANTGCRRNIVMRDLNTDTAELVVTLPDGSCPNKPIYDPTMSNDGDVMYDTDAKLTSDDTYPFDDVYTTRAF